MHAFTAISVLATLFAPAFAAIGDTFTCNEPLLSSCCINASNTPRGYVGTECIPGVYTNGTTPETPRDEQVFVCPPENAKSLCCQKFETLSNGIIAAYTCGPRDV